MKAIIHHDYGPPDVLRCEEIDKPAAGDDQVLIQVRAASVNPLDWRMMRGSPYLGRMAFGLRRPNDTRPGRDVAGLVEAVGRNVTQVKPGDAVFGAGRGSLAEYACAAASAVVIKPQNVTFEQAASSPVAGLTALQALRDKGQIQPGQKVLINGAAGGVGTFAVQIASWLGAEVTGVCSTRNVEMVRSLGAAQVIDYTREDFTRRGERYDVVLDCIVNHPLSACRRVLKPGGRCIIVGAPHSPWLIGFIARLIKALLTSPFSSRKVMLFMARSSREDLSLMGELMATGRVIPVIDRRYSLNQVPEAMGYLEKGHARGKVVISVDHGNTA